MILLAGGDSFTWGNELPDCDGSRFSRQSWSALLAERQGMDYYCVAKPGSSNQSIARRVMQAIDSSDQVDHVAVMWTYMTRYELRLIDHLEKELLGIEQSVDAVSDLDSGWLNLSTWQSADLQERLSFFPELRKDAYFVNKLKAKADFDERSGIRSLSKNYYFLASTEHHRTLTLNSIFLLQSYLRQKDIEYTFCCASDEVIDCLKSNDPLSKMIDRSRFLNLDRGFVEWSKTNGHAVSVMNHPVTSAHKDWIESYT